MNDQVAGSVLAGMFGYALPCPQFRQRLRAVGVDLEELAPSYPLSVWYEALALARQHFFAQLSDEEAGKQLGAAATDGFLQTLAGRVVGASYKLLGPARVVDRQPAILGLLHKKGGRKVDIHVEALGATARRMRMGGAFLYAGFVCGMLEAIVRAAGGREPVTRVEHDTPGDIVVTVRWQD